MASPLLPTAAQQLATQQFGAWLADQEWAFDTDGEIAWVLDEDGRYLAEGIYEDSENRMVPNEEMKRALRLMQHAPRMLRFMLRAMKALDNATLNDSTKLEHVQGLLAEVVGQALAGQGAPLDVARAVQDRQASRE